MAQQGNGMGNNNGKGRGLKIAGFLVLVVLAGTAIVWLKVVRGSDDPTSMMPTFTAKRGPLVISVLESGAIKAKEQEIIRNEVEGRSTIISIIPEGTYVQKGDVLIELDVSALRDRKIDQEIRMQNAEASYINAKETLDITRSQALSDVEKAALTLKFAKQDLEVYLEGKYLNDKTSAMNKVEEANEVFIRAQDVLKWSQMLYDEKYISETELKADKLSVTRNENALTVAKNDLNLLEKFTKQRNIDQFESDVKQAEMSLQRTEAKARANLVQAEADLKAKEQEFNREVTKLQKMDDQLGKAIIKAPVDGMVVYATSSRSGFGRDDQRPLADGVEVYERRELIYIPKSSSSVAEVDVHEASLDKVRAGLPAVVTVDALPGKKFLGTVARIAPLPNAQSMWMNPDLKVYTTNINLETDDSGLRSGMSCKAEIIVEQYKDVVYVPVQSVLRVAGRPTVFVVRDGLIQERQVEIGMDNNSMVMIRSGLSEGEVVLLTPPLKAATLEPGQRIPGSGDANDTTAQRISEKLKAANELATTGSGRMPGRGTPLPTEGNGQPAATGEAEQGQAGAQGIQMPSAEQIQRFQNMSQEEREKMIQERLQNMTPEEREQAEQARQRFQNMSPEEREQMRPRRGTGGRGEGAPGSGGRGEGGGRRGGAGSETGQSEGGQ